MSLLYCILLSAAIFPGLIFIDYRRRQTEGDDYDVNQDLAGLFLTFSPFTLLFYADQFWHNLIFYFLPLYFYCGILLYISDKKKWSLHGFSLFTVYTPVGIFGTVFCYFLFIHEGIGAENIDGENIDAESTGVEDITSESGNAHTKTPIENNSPEASRSVSWLPYPLQILLHYWTYVLIVVFPLATVAFKYFGSFDHSDDIKNNESEEYDVVDSDVTHDINLNDTVSETADMEVVEAEGIEAADIETAGIEAKSLEEKESELVQEQQYLEKFKKREIKKEPVSERWYGIFYMLSTIALPILALFNDHYWWSMLLATGMYIAMTSYCAKGAGTAAGAYAAIFYFYLLACGGSLMVYAIIF